MSQSDFTYLAQAKCYIEYVRSTELDIQLVKQDGELVKTCTVSWGKKGEDRRMRAAYWLERAAADIKRMSGMRQLGDFIMVEGIRAYVEVIAIDSHWYLARIVDHIKLEEGGRKIGVPGSQSKLFRVSHALNEHGMHTNLGSV